LKYPKLTVKDIRDVVIIFIAVTVLTVLHFLITDFPLFPDTTRLVYDAGEVEFLSPTGSDPIDLKTFLEMRERDSVLIIDTRSYEDFVSGHIPDAVNIPYEETHLYLSDLEQLKDIRYVITYCDGDDCLSSVETAGKLVFIFPVVRYFFGGWKSWTDSGYPVETGPGRNWL